MPLWMIMVTTLTWIDGWYMLIWPMEMDGTCKLGEWWILLLCWHYWWFIKVTPVRRTWKIAVDPISSEPPIFFTQDVMRVQQSETFEVRLASPLLPFYVTWSFQKMWWTSGEHLYMDSWMDVLPPWLNYGCLFSLKVPQILRENVSFLTQKVGLLPTFTTSTSPSFCWHHLRFLNDLRGLEFLNVSEISLACHELSSRSTTIIPSVLFSFFFFVPAVLARTWTQTQPAPPVRPTWRPCRPSLQSVAAVAPDAVGANGCAWQWWPGRANGWRGCPHGVPGRYLADTASSNMGIPWG